MKCDTCGAPIKPNAHYCKACGSRFGDAAGGYNDKKARVMARERTWLKPLAIAGVVVAVAAGIWLAQGVLASRKMGGHPMFAPNRDVSARIAQAEPVRERDGTVSIPLSVFEEGKARFFSYASGDKTITFFGIKTADGGIRVAIDACMACNHAKLGYRQESGYLVCNNCGMGFKPQEVGTVTGGCSPIPAEKSIANQMVVLKTRDLEAGAKYF